MATADDLARALAQRTGFEPLDISATANQLRVIGRVHPNGSSAWVLMVHHLLLTCERTAWKVDISRYYFLRQMESGQKRLFYTWRLLVQGQEVSQHFGQIIQTIASAPRPNQVELQEFPLAGAQRNHRNGKGAYSAETTPMVAHMAAAARMGGVRS